MFPLALILRGQGATVCGSDRSFDQGRMSEKFSWIQSQGIDLFPQDGSGISTDLTALVVSTAVEDSIPDVKSAKEKGVPIITRAQLLAQIFNTAETRIAIAGTSGKSTTTGMIGYVLQMAGKAPTVMNGAVFRNFQTEQTPYATALSGSPDLFITEDDESDGSIALYDPTIAVLNNIALDHKTMPELIALFNGFVGKAGPQSSISIIYISPKSPRIILKHQLPTPWTIQLPDCRPLQSNLAQGAALARLSIRKPTCHHP